ncbi:uncharacterized protein LOC110055547 [Orbicella faveolata]|uniref:uncharacterized protein LOC110055547 n=1 Tax=Orbicella faveolata TaxID=48498 RepID=UPI0009E50D91|nr:uncharacterized protein LOC110055547 [Orbicella faveolata]
MSTLTLIALLVLVSMATPPALCALLSYEAQDTVLDLMTEKDFTGLGSANLLAKDGPRPVYRKDLEPNNIAYYEILSGDGKDYFLLSSGSKTGDNRFVESGDVNAKSQQYRPTDKLNMDAAKNGQTCFKHYRLSQAGIYMCEDRNGVPVAANYNWTSNAPIDTKQWKSLAAMVKASLPDFNKEWRELSYEVGEEGEWGSLRQVQSVQKQVRYGEEALESGSKHRISLGFYNSKSTPRIFFTGTSGMKSNLTAADWQKKLCAVLVNVCSGRDLTYVNRRLFLSARNGIKFFELSVHDDKSTVQKILMNTDISFRVQLTTSDGIMMEKRFGIETNFTSRTKRWSSWSYWSIHHPHLFPNYNQHRCCGCYSGCGPVAWAQIFAYYDRLAHISSSYGYNQKLYQGYHGVSGSASWQPPWYTPRYYVEDIRAKVDTFCLFGGGATTHWDMTDSKLRNWYLTRQYPQGGSLSSYTSWWSTLPGIYRSWIRNSAINAVKNRYPAIVGIWVGSSQHYAVATRYRSRYKKWRICWWFFGWHCTQWFYIYRREWYLHMGWGGSGNVWKKAKAFSAFVARH